MNASSLRLASSCMVQATCASPRVPHHPRPRSRRRHRPAVSAGVYVLPVVSQGSSHVHRVTVVGSSGALQLGTLDRNIRHLLGLLFSFQIQQSHRDCRALVPHACSRRTSVHLYMGHVKVDSSICKQLGNCGQCTAPGRSYYSCLLYTSDAADE